MTLATSCTDSRVPMPISLSVMNRVSPPSWRMATSKLTLVRRLGLAKTQASTRLGWVWGSSWARARGFCSLARSSTARSSSLVQRSMEIKSLSRAT
jgi:hypothetical protein